MFSESMLSRHDSVRLFGKKLGGDICIQNFGNGKGLYPLIDFTATESIARGTRASAPKIHAKKF
jgi:hypothetical protein